MTRNENSQENNQKLIILDIPTHELEVWQKDFGKIKKMLYDYIDITECLGDITSDNIVLENELIMFTEFFDSLDIYDKFDFRQSDPDFRMFAFLHDITSIYYNRNISEEVKYKIVFTDIGCRVAVSRLFSQQEETSLRDVISRIVLKMERDKEVNISMNKILSYVPIESCNFFVINDVIQDVINRDQDNQDNGDKDERKSKNEKRQEEDENEFIKIDYVDEDGNFGLN